MDIKLFDSELKVMDVLWKEGDLTAKRISDILHEQVGWNVNTTYTLIKRCIKKGAIERSEPGFQCHALIPREQIQEQETTELINKVFRRQRRPTLRLSFEPQKFDFSGDRTFERNRQ